MTILRIATYNTLCYAVNPSKLGEQERYERIAQVIREVDADVLLVQELASPEAMAQLAEATDMKCVADNLGGDGSQITCHPGNDRLGIGIMWRRRSGIEPVPGTLKLYRDALYFHGLIKVVLDCGGAKIMAAATHLTPFGAPHIVTEAKRVVSNLTRPDNRPPAFVGSDSNSISGDRVRHANGAWGWHAPDPYASQEWFPDLFYHCKWRYDETTGERVHWADREAGDALWSGGLYETGAILGVDVAANPTTGHWPEGDPYGPRDVDHVRVTEELVSRVRKSWVHRTATTEIASDHRPKVVELDITNLTS